MTGPAALQKPQERENGRIKDITLFLPTDAADDILQDNGERCQGQAVTAATIIDFAIRFLLTFGARFTD